MVKSLKMIRLHVLGKVSKGQRSGIKYNQVPHLTQDTNGKVTNSQLDTTNENQEVGPFLAGDHKAIENNYLFMMVKSLKIIRLQVLRKHPR